MYGTHSVDEKLIPNFGKRSDDFEHADADTMAV
jgi:hypothetical protein